MDIFGRQTTESGAPQEIEEAGFSLPSYMHAINAHNIANNNWSWGDAVTLGTAGVAASALTQTWNILPTLGNLLGGDFEQVKTQEVLQSFDDDLGKYYADHQGGIDALGFAVSSLVPGTAGIKIGKAGFNVLRGAAETGTFGAGIEAATGILAPKSAKLLSEATELALKPNAGFPIWNAKTVQALAQGAGQAALEGAAFETAVAATMYNSPTLKDQDFGDLVSNVIHGAGMFGAFGAVFHGAGTYFKIKNAGRELDKELFNFNTISELHPDAKAADHIMNYFDQLHSLPDVGKAAVAGDWTGANAWKLGKAESMLEGKVNYLKTKVQENTLKLAGGDQDLAGVLYQNYSKLSLEQAESKIFSSLEVTRLGTTTATEVAQKKLIQEAVAKGDPEIILQGANRSVTYLKLAGEDAGRIVSEAPELYNIADKIKKGTDYDSVVAGYRQNLGRTRQWDFMDTDALTSEARYVTAARTKFTEETVVHIDDLPYLQAAYLKGVEKLQVAEDGFKSEFNSTGRIINEISRQELLELISATKDDAAAALLAKGHDPEYIAKVLDMKRELVEGTLRGVVDDSLFVTRTGDEWSKPQWAKVIKDTDPVKDIDGNVVTGMIALKQKQVNFEDAADRIKATVLGEDADKIFRIQDQYIARANRFGPGNGMFSAQNENYGTLGSMAQNLGANTLKVIGRAQDRTREVFTPLLQKLQLNQPAAIEWSVLNARLRQYSEGFTYSAEEGGMIPTKLHRYNQAIAAGEDVAAPVFEKDLPLLIPIKNPEVADLVGAHVATNSERIGKLGAIRSNQGVNFKRDAASFYPIPQNPKDYPFFAHVVDDTIAGYGHSKMLFAGSQAELEAQITAVKSADPTLKVLTKADAEGYYKAIGQYEFERTLTDTAFNPAVARAGKSANYLPPTDPAKIVADTLNWHLQRDASLVRETVLHVNEAQVQTLRTLGESYANVKNSHFTSLDPVSYLEMQGANPYADYVKTMLGLSTSKEFPFWTPLNDMLDRKVSQVLGALRSGIQQSKSPEELVAMNAALKSSGYTGAAYDSMTAALANSSAPRGVLSSFVAKANSILSATMLGWDPINAVNNLVGATVLRSTELKSLLRNIEQAKPELAGELSELSGLKVPGTSDSIFSPAKMIARAMGEFHSDAGKLLRAEFNSRGIISSRVEQSNWVLDNLAVTGREGVAELEGKISKVWAGTKDILAKGDVITGNKLAEDFNRFVSGHVVKQITDKAVAAGVLGEQEAWAYINTFVNRVEGNYIAAQRPGIFQGPLGQAMGLFQTYQFNMLQQLFRHVGEGTAKDSILMAGLQGSLYGLKGMPAFDAINTHILGNASGNVEHKDAYTSIYGAAGKEAGDWLMYGVASNALGLLSPDLKLNLYSRGDINPRNVTVLPLNPVNYPFVQASGKLFGALAETAGKISSGGDVWGSILQGIEHAGVNRPLAGLAQTLEATNNPYAASFSTSNRGNVVAANDFTSLANMIRIAGAKPLDEAIGLDKMYNIEAYAASDKERRNSLGEAVKTTLIAGKVPTQDQLNKFVVSYAGTGGQQQNFAQWMIQQYRAANTSQVNILAQQMRNPTARAMQEVMGGYGMKDFAAFSQQ